MTNWEQFFGTPERAAHMDVNLYLGKGATVRCYGVVRDDGTADVLRHIEADDYEKWLNEEADHD